MLNLDKTEAEILAQMKPKGRYNIQVAKRHGIIVERLPGETVDENILNDFYEILQKTGERDLFGIHPKYFYKNLLEIFGAQNMADLFLAKTRDKKIIAGIIVIYYKDTATYYYGASDYEYRNLMAPYLLQWEAILEARRREMKYYDFLGIAPGDNESEKNAGKNTGRAHPWTGVTDFKKKFGGREVKYPPAFDVIYKPTLYRLLKFVKRHR
ncbi:peptidoglycan bridge formation glycyltransferase FemA/FemB family protein [Candidatus Peregrinibacteria bacterium]|nr:peptidoglycan bridge formation glycyltransferase FemA/FemB family protein [Candidatus Peregrinibacteria bacterium]